MKTKMASKKKKKKQSKLKIVPKDEDVLPASPFDRPAFLPDPAAELWDTLVVRLREAGILDEVDGPALVNLVMSHYFALHAGTLLLRDGMVEEDEAHAGRLRKHPAFQMWRDSQAAFSKWADRFRVTPAARKGPLAGAEGELSEMEKLLRGRERDQKR